MTKLLKFCFNFIKISVIRLSNILSSFFKFFKNFSICVSTFYISNFRFFTDLFWLFLDFLNFLINLHYFFSNHFSINSIFLRLENFILYLLNILLLFKHVFTFIFIGFINFNFWFFWFKIVPNLRTKTYMTLFITFFKSLFKVFKCYYFFINSLFNFMN